MTLSRDLTYSVCWSSDLMWLARTCWERMEVITHGQLSLVLITLQRMWAIMTPIVAVITVTAMPCSSPYT